MKRNHVQTMLLKYLSLSTGLQKCSFNAAPYTLGNDDSTLLGPRFVRSLHSTRSVTRKHWQTL